MDLGLRGRRVLVTGGSGRIGRAIAVAFAREGARVAFTYRDRAEEAQRTAEATARVGAGATVARLDLGDRASLEPALAAIRRDLGGDVEVLVNNAVAWPARVPGALFEATPAEAMRASVQANLLGPYALSQAVVGPMRGQGWGRIVHVSTGLVEDGFPGSAPYTTPKAALHGLARTMSRELAGSGIFTNVVMAGFVADPATPAAIVAQASRSAATGRTSTPDEVANVIVFLCSAANGNVTGESVRADGHFLAIAA